MVIMETSDALASSFMLPNASAVSEDSVICASECSDSPHSVAVSNINKYVKPQKRSWADQMEEVNNKKPNSLTNIPKFLIISSEDNLLAKMSPFFIQKGLLGIAGNPTTVKKLRSGDLLIETSSPLQAKSLLSANKLGNIAITVSPHKTLNTSRGVISEFELLHVSESEIVAELADQGIIQAKRITIKKGADIISTKHIILTFNTPTLPSHINAGYIRCPVRPYIPNPLRCFNCQRFGHSKVSCRGQLACSRCSAVGHSFEDCQLEAKCVNCLGAHSSNSKNCPKWLQEKEVQKIRATQNLTYPEARKIVQSSQPRQNLSYASAVKTALISTGTQTMLSISTEKNIEFPGEPPKRLSITPKVKVNETSSQTPSSTVPKQKTAHQEIEFLIPLPKTDKQNPTKGKSRRKTKDGISLEKLTSESSDSGEMEVEKGMETPVHLLPKVNKPKLLRPPKSTQ